MKSSPRPRLVQCIATEFALCSTAFLWRSGWHFMAFARRFQCACATLLKYALRFHGVRIAFPWRSGTALTACGQSRYDVSIICSFALSAVPAYTSTQIEKTSSFYGIFMVRNHFYGSADMSQFNTIYDLSLTLYWLTYLKCQSSYHL